MYILTMYLYIYIYIYIYVIITHVYTHTHTHKYIQKLAEMLAFCGDRGKYLVGLTDIDPELKSLFIKLLDLLGKYIRVNSNGRQNKAVHKELVDVLAEFEIRLPLYWNTIARHILLHMCKLMDKFGSFCVWNMLPVERLHVLIKKMARSSKNMLKSLDNHYDMYMSCQLKLHFENPKLWKHKNRKTLSTAVPLKPPCGHIEYPAHKGKPMKLDSSRFAELLNIWGLADPTFKAVRGRYATYVKKMKKQKKSYHSFRKWAPTDRENNDDEKKMQKIKKTVLRVPWVTLDGVRFCTRAVAQKRVTDNSCIFNLYKEKNTGREELAVGVIEALYVHKQYDSHDAPWTVMVEASWYERTGYNSVNGLMQISRNENFDTCKYANLKTCLPVNCVFWRSKPFEKQTIDSLYDVITHYEGWSGNGERLKPYMQ
jgi:hypothetical protein